MRAPDRRHRPEDPNKDPKFWTWAWVGITCLLCAGVILGLTERTDHFSLYTLGWVLLFIGVLATIRTIRRS